MKIKIDFEIELTDEECRLYKLLYSNLNFISSVVTFEDWIKQQLSQSFEYEVAEDTENVYNSLVYNFGISAEEIKELTGYTVNKYLVD